MKRRAILKAATLLPLFNNQNQMIVNQDFKHKKIIKPKRLKAGDTIGVIAPSSGYPTEKIDKALAGLENLNFKLKLGKYLRERNGFLAGTDSERVQDLHAMFADPSVDGIWCLRGGYGATRILPLLDYQLIKKNPKVFIGYSDITAFLLAIFQQTGLVTFHGPVGTSEYNDYTRTHALNILMNPTPQYSVPLSVNMTSNESNLYKTEVIQTGSCQGTLIGGNLSLLSAMAGTKYGLKNKDLKGKILFIEDIEERPYRIDRMLTQMLQSVDFKQLSGIALGVFEGCNPKPDESSWSLIDTLKDRLGNLGIPVYYGLSFGHIKEQFTLPMGIQATLDTEGGVLTFLEPCVI
jgi:muramoyltetrapeptide carboxypeptidase